MRGQIAPTRPTMSGRPQATPRRCGWTRSWRRPISTGPWPGSASTSLTRPWPISREAIQLRPRRQAERPHHKQPPIIFAAGSNSTVGRWIRRSPTTQRRWRPILGWPRPTTAAASPTRRKDRPTRRSPTTRPFFGWRRNSSRRKRRPHFTCRAAAPTRRCSKPPRCSAGARTTRWPIVSAARPTRRQGRFGGGHRGLYGRHPPAARTGDGLRARGAAYERLGEHNKAIHDCTRGDPA